MAAPIVLWRKKQGNRVVKSNEMRFTASYDVHAKRMDRSVVGRTAKMSYSKDKDGSFWAKAEETAVSLRTSVARVRMVREGGGGYGRSDKSIGLSLVVLVEEFVLVLLFELLFFFLFLFEDDDEDDADLGSMILLSATTVYPKSANTAKVRDNRAKADGVGLLGHGTLRSANIIQLKQRKVSMCIKSGNKR